MLKPTVQVHDVDGVLVAEFWDCLRLDPAPVQDLRKEFDAHRQRHGRPELVVDLSGVGFAGSAALGGFLALRRQGARLIFCNVDPTVREVFRVSKLEPLFGFEADRAAALAHALAHANGAAEPAGTPPAADGQATPTPPAAPSRPPLRRARDGRKS